RCCTMSLRYMTWYRIERQKLRKCGAAPRLQESAGPGRPGSVRLGEVSMGRKPAVDVGGASSLDRAENRERHPRIKHKPRHGCVAAIECEARLAESEGRLGGVGRVAFLGPANRDRALERREGVARPAEPELALAEAHERPCQIGVHLAHHLIDCNRALIK